MNGFMFSFLANTVPDPADFPVPESALDKLGYGLQVTVVGLGTVFFVLFVLMAVLYLFKLFFHTIPQKKALRKEDGDKVFVPAENPVIYDDLSEDDEIAAVIAAAVASIYDGAPSAKSRQNYKIKSFKRI